MKALEEYLLRLGDNSLVVGQRLSEWCGHGPALEEDIALTNIALDLVGQARLFLSFAAELEGNGRNEDDLAFLRDVIDYRNVLLAEQPNRDFAHTIVRQMLMDAFNLELYTVLAASSDTRLAEIAEKSLKETRYHHRHSSRWMIRLGDGTPESHQRTQDALDTLWIFTGELFEADEVETALAAEGITVPANSLKPAWDARVDAVLGEATVTRPSDAWMAGGGKLGQHTEHLGFMLAEMQFLQRAYPGASW